MTDLGTIPEWYEIQRLMESAPIAILIVKSDCTVVFANRKAMELAAMSRAMFVGKTIDILLPEDMRPLHADLMAGWFDRPVSRPMGLVNAIHLRTGRGKDVPVNIELHSHEVGLEIYAVAWITPRQE